MSRFFKAISLPNVLSSSRRPVGATISRSADEELFERFLTGDDAAAVVLFRAYNTRLFLYCVKVLGDQEQAEDVTQEIWERAIRLRGGSQRIGNVAGFLFRIARNLCINQLKRRGRSVSIDAIDAASHPACLMPGNSDTEELVSAALDTLRFEDRELLVLNVYCGYRLDEIAEMMEMKPNAIWTRASRARAQLRTIVADMMNPRTDNNEQGRGR